ncbi:MAG: hypothetical protein VB118_04665 [Oscillospiraceae bacterium]|nr:hypothetical protein [Oscillospiraceae bacterium]
MTELEKFLYKNISKDDYTDISGDREENESEKIINSEKYQSNANKIPEIVDEIIKIFAREELSYDHAEDVLKTVESRLKFHAEIRLLSEDSKKYKVCEA